MIRRHRALALAICTLVTVPAVAQAQLPSGDLTRRPPPPTLPGDEEIFQTIREITSHGPRRIGKPGGDFAVDYVAGKLRSYGLTGVHVEQTPTYGWEARSHGLTVAGQPVDAFPMAYSQSPSATAVGDSSTPPGGLRAPVVDVGFGTAAEVAAHDVRGKIVMFDLKFVLPLAGLVPFTEFLWDPENTLLRSPMTLIGANPYITTYTDAAKAAMDGGAVGIVGVLSDYFDSNRYYNEFYRRLVVTVPGMWVTKKEGARIRTLLATNPGAEANMTLETSREKTPAHAVVGYLEGESPDTIMVQSHHDSVFDGAVEDGSGVAEVLALAKHYAAQPRSSREKSMMFTTFDSHFSGYQAHFAFAKRHITHRDPDREPHRIVANVTLEHIAKAATAEPGGPLQVSELPEPRGIFENLNPALKTELASAVVRNDLRRTALLNGTPFQPVGIPTDASAVLAAGVPTASLIAGPLYLYDAADTLDKVLEGELQEVAQAFVELTDAIDETPSEVIGVAPNSATTPVGVAVLDHFGGNKGTETSVDRIERRRLADCSRARSGRPISRVRLRRDGRMTALRFRVRRRTVLRLVVNHSDGTSDRIKTLRAVRACRSYRVPLPANVVAARLSWRRGAVSAPLGG